MRGLLSILLSASVLLAFTGCGSTGTVTTGSGEGQLATETDSGRDGGNETDARPFAFDGIVTTLVSSTDDESGQWLIRDTISGDTLQPLDLPAAFHQDGLAVHGLAIDAEEDDSSTSEFRLVHIEEIFKHEPPAPEPFVFDGIVTTLVSATDDESGEWLIRDTISGDTLQPLDLPEAFHQDGLAVHGLAIDAEEDDSSTSEFRLVHIEEIFKHEPPAPEPFVFDGIVTTLVSATDDESGEWLIRDTISGDTLQPLDLPEAFHQDGLAVHGLALDAKNIDEDIPPSEFRVVVIEEIHKHEPPSDSATAFSGEIAVLEQDNGDEWLIRADGLGFLAPLHLPDEFRQPGLLVEGRFVRRDGDGNGSSMQKALAVTLVIIVRSEDQPPKPPHLIGLLDRLEVGASTATLLLVEDRPPLVVTSMPADADIPAGSMVKVSGTLAIYGDDDRRGPAFIAIDSIDEHDPSN